MKVALLHDLLVKIWWAEKVLEKLVKIFPEADIFTLIYDEKKVWSMFKKNQIKYTPKLTQTIYNITKNQRYCLPFMQAGVESFDLKDYDLVIASNSAFVHGAITKPETKFIVYYHTPVRYLWDRTNEYKEEIWFNKWIKKIILNIIFKKLRIWDQIARTRHDITIANSKNVAKRLKKYYKLDSKVIYPNVDTIKFNKKIKSNFKIPFEKKDYYIIVSALTEFKKIDLRIKAFNKMYDKNLVIVWTWNYKKTLQKLRQKDWIYEKPRQNIMFLWRKYDDELVYLMQNSKWLIFPWEEDFWIVPIEAMSAWIPVFAYRWWWLAETMIEWITWEFFNLKSWDDFIEKFKIFEENINLWIYKKDQIQKHREKYNEERFEREILEIINNIKN